MARASVRWPITSEAPAVDGLDTEAQSVPSNTARFGSSKVHESIARFLGTGRPIRTCAHPSLLSEAGKVMSVRVIRPEESYSTNRGTCHGFDNVYGLGVSSFLSSTSIEIHLIAFMLTIPSTTSFSATFRDAILSSLPSSVRPDPDKEAIPSDSTIQEDGFGRCSFC